MKKVHGFTLVELIVVMVIVGVLAGSVAIFFVPAVNNYVAVARRANLTDMADGAMRTISRDIRAAVPNSIRTPSPQCFEVVPTSTGGRYRTEADITWDADPANAANLSAPASSAALVQSFDVVTPLTTIPAAGDWIVVSNQNTDDVYASPAVNRAAIANVETPFPPATGAHRITLTGPFQIPLGYTEARFVVVPNAQQAVFHVCANAGLDANGNGSGTLYRFSPYPFGGGADACPTPNTATPVLATHVEECVITYDPSPGAAQNSGYVQVKLKLTERNESVTIQFGTHADNVP